MSNHFCRPLFVVFLEDPRLRAKNGTTYKLYRKVFDTLMESFSIGWFDALPRSDQEAIQTCLYGANPKAGTRDTNHIDVYNPGSVWKPLTTARRWVEECSTATRANAVLVRTAFDGQSGGEGVAPRVLITCPSMREQAFGADWEEKCAIMADRLRGLGLALIQNANTLAMLTNGWDAGFEDGETFDLSVWDDLVVPIDIGDENTVQVGPGLLEQWAQSRSE